MKTHDDFRTLLAGTDQSLTPDPLFARRLRHRFLAESQAWREGSGNSDIGPEPRPIRRSRLFDLAAVAILVLSMIGGMIGLNPGAINNSTPTVRAAESPVQSPDPSSASLFCEDENLDMSCPASTEIASENIASPVP